TNLTLNAPDTVIMQNEWANIITVLDADRNYAAIYVNGELAVETHDFTRNPSIIETYDQNYIGQSADNSLFYGGLDDLQIYNRVLSPAEIELIASGPPALAGKPSPRDGAIDVPQEVALTWRPGAYVEGLSPKHKVFFSENFDDVNDGIGGIEQDVARYPIDGSLKLDLGKTCYWRVDEANSTTGWDIGALWKFTVIDHLLVDDFESYNDLDTTDSESNRIFNTWLDGFDQPTNGAIVGYADPPFCEQTIVHSGGQSMPLAYNTGTANYSEAQRTFSPGQDWTREGVETLSLWFRGHPEYVGSFAEAPAGTYTMTASGTDIWSRADEFHFAYKELSGAGAIIAKVESVAHTDPWAKAGVMIRDTLDADSRYAAVLVTPENGVRFQYRSTAGANTSRSFAEGITAPQWVKLERTTGGLVRAFYSADGTTWTNFNLVQVRMDMPVYIGLAVTSHNPGLTCEAKFSKVSFGNTSVGPQWTDRDVGMLSNVAEPMYVTLGDGSGTAATVYHANPDAALINTWTQWNIDTKEFGDTGVVLTDVDKMAIGLGGPDNPQAGGSGLMYFDDIRLYPPR
ncbi:MAG: LamG-like jellyroll fold domain-containing protein, partial [Planctomycetota bacterium]